MPSKLLNNKFIHFYIDLYQINIPYIATCVREHYKVMIETKKNGKDTERNDEFWKYRKKKVKT